MQALCDIDIDGLFWLPSQDRAHRRASIFSVESSMIHSIVGERIRNEPQRKAAIFC
jgi:hypothetical protein